MRVRISTTDRRYDVTEEGDELLFEPVDPVSEADAEFRTFRMGVDQYRRWCNGGVILEEGDGS